MSNANNENNNNVDRPEKKKKKKRKKHVFFRVFLLVALVACIVVGGALAGMVLGIIKSAPEIDPTNILDTLAESSVIVDENGTFIEQIRDPNENREIVGLSQMPKNLQNAFIAIEDQRFKDHFGIDIRRIGGSLIYNIFKRGDDENLQGASTITQQLVKNLYFSNEQSYERKIKEIYLAIQMERKLSKDQILENYLNTIPLGQSAYGVQAAAYTYFSKDVSELTLPECAILAGAAKSTVRYAPYKRYNMSDLSGISEDDIIGYVYIGSVQYACVYNQTAVDRMKTVLKEMLNQGLISQSEYDTAVAADMHQLLTPGQTKIEGISSNFSDYTKEQVINDLMSTYSRTYEEAENMLYKGGLKIYTTMDVNMQKSLEDAYKNFPVLFLGAEPTGSSPMGLMWSSRRITGLNSIDSAGNAIDEYGRIIYFAKENLLDEAGNVYLTPEEYSYDDKGNLIINSRKFGLGTSSVKVLNCYTVDDSLNFISHSLGAVMGLNLGTNCESLEAEGNKAGLRILKSYLDQNPDMFKSSADGNLLLAKEFILGYDERGVVQPQSASVVIDYRTGEIKAMIGGRDIEGSKTWNRATDTARQPGSTIKPLSVYLPALDLGYTAATVIDDLPRYNGGKRWPKNWQEQFGRSDLYWGNQTIRQAIEQSINVCAVNMVEKIGFDAAMDSLAKLGLINKEHPENDSFVTPEEDPNYNDVNPASLGLGGLTKGFSPLGMTAAYATIANDGTYIEPSCYTKVEDTDGNIILEKMPETHQAVTQEVAGVMKDMLRSSVYSGLAYRAKLPERMGIEVAGKTGTTSDNGDFWFMGFTPYYVAGVWVGSDNVQMKLSGDSGATARLWSGIMTPIHEGLEPAKIEISQNLVRASVCVQSGKVPTELCGQDQRGSQIRSELFVPGTQPSEACDVHEAVEVCTVTNLLKSPYCPGNTVETRVFIKRDYDAYAHGYNGPIPTDSAQYANLKLYQQIQEERMSMDLDELKTKYAGQAEFDENKKVISVNGVLVENLYYDYVRPSDYQYQVPTEMCISHTPWHYEQWLQNGSSDSENGNEDENNENNENNDNNENGENTGDENNNPTDENNPPVENNPDDSGDQSGDGMVESEDDKKPDDSSSILDSITN